MFSLSLLCKKNVSHIQNYPCKYSLIWKPYRHKEMELLPFPVPEMRASPKNFFWASKKLVTGTNGIMMAQSFCEILKKKKTSDINI